MTSNTRSRLTPDRRRQQILNAALKCAEYKGLSNMTREDVAQWAFVAPATVGHYFAMEELRIAVVELAVEVHCLRVVRDGLFMGYDAAVNAPESLRQKAIATIAG